MNEKLLHSDEKDVIIKTLWEQAQCMKKLLHSQDE